MNTPNKLTLVRMVMVPLFMALMLTEFRFHYLAALLVFIVASLTDLLDGKIARKQNIVTNFGKFLDPIADKMLTTAAFLSFAVLGLGFGTVWVTLIIMLREFLVSSVRMIAAGSGRVIAADKWGKTKTVFQMISVITVLTFEFSKELLSGLISDAPWLNTLFSVCDIVSSVLLWLSAVLTVVSGVNYLIKNKQFINSSK